MNFKLYKAASNCIVRSNIDFSLKQFIFLVAVLLTISKCGEEVIENINYQNELDYVKDNYSSIDYGATIDVCTTNIKNKYLQGEQTENHLQELIKQEMDLICTQETTVKFMKEMESKIGDYDIYGEPRWGNGIIGHVFGIANETNSIITSYDTYLNTTTGLPWIPRDLDEVKECIENLSIMRRIVTSSVVDISDVGYVRVYNTHLDYGSKGIQRRQMECLLEIIKKDLDEIKLPTIITGDFNAIPDDSNMQYFQAELQKLNIYSVNNFLKTYDQKQLDYIFVSDNLFSTKTVTIDNPNSDHKTVQTSLTPQVKKHQKIKSLSIASHI